MSHRTSIFEALAEGAVKGDGWYGSYGNMEDICEVIAKSGDAHIVWNALCMAHRNGAIESAHKMAIVVGRIESNMIAVNEMDIAVLKLK